MGCGSCGNPSCTGCGSCVQNVLTSGVVLTQAQCAGTRPCSPADTCSSPQPASPSPYYNCNTTCEEDHCQQIFTQSYATAICTNYAFNVPACGTTANIYFSDVKILPVGAYIWHETYGYFEVVAFNNQTGLATILNHCNEDNAAVGTNVPACTCFIVTPTPVPDNDPTNFPFVAVDFVAPADSDCIDIAVTSVNGLAVGGSVTIGTGIYRLEAVVSPTLITICNDGEGITPGTVVVAQNDAGEYQYPITQIGANPCSNTAASTGIVLVCDSGSMKPLDGSSAGDVLTLQNAGSNVAAYVSPGFVTQLYNQSANKSGTITNLQTLVSNVASVTFTNTHPSKTAQVFAALEYFFNCDVTEAGGADVSFGLSFELQLNGGGYSAIRTMTDGFFVEAAFVAGRSFNLAHVASVAPGASHNLDIRFSILNVGADSMDFTAAFRYMLCQITGIAVAA